MLPWPEVVSAHRQPNALCAGPFGSAVAESAAAPYLHDSLTRLASNNRQSGAP